MNGMGFKLYLLFVISWFLHLTSRIPALGAIRFDLLLILLISIIILGGKGGEIWKVLTEGSAGILTIICFYILLTLPLVQWPGSVLNTGVSNFIKGIVFYYFTVLLITTEKKLKIFITVFLACQSFRVFEPVYLHITGGYWGDIASMANWEFMERLSGAPHDIINPNGLAFVITSILPFAYYLGFSSLRWGIASLCATPIFLYALALTGSRSGLVGLIAIMIGILMKSRKKALLIFVFVSVIGTIFMNLTPDQQDRYLSTFSSNTKNAATAEGRTEGIINNFKVALRRPLFGHGLGTSREANANFGGTDKVAHNLYAEIAQELGFMGLLIFVYFMKSVATNFVRSVKKLRENSGERGYLLNIGNAMQIWLFMNFMFSFASYGLSSYEWYLFGGLSVILTQLTHAKEKSLPSTDCGKANDHSGT